MNITRKEDTKSPAIVLKNVFKDFRVGKNVINVLKDVNLEIPEHDFIVVYGPSGCGKSTLLNIVLGIEDSTKGDVIMEGVDLSALDEDKRSSYRLETIGMIHQMPYWIKSLNVGENVALPLLIRGVKEKVALKKAVTELRKLSMEKYAHQLPTQLSGGQQQRVSLARALVTNPKIIIADEPTGNLDTTNSDMVMGIFDMLNKDFGKTILLVTHNHAYWDVGTRRIEIQDGKIIRDTRHGPPLPDKASR